MTVPAAGVPQHTEAQAQADALQRGHSKGEQLCRDMDAAGLTRFRALVVAPEAWACDRTREGVACGFEGRVLCTQDELVRTEQEQCGSVARP